MELLRKPTDGTKEKPRKVNVLYSKLDISRISVIDPETNEIFSVSAQGIHSPISLNEYKSYLEDFNGNTDTPNLPQSLTASFEAVGENKTRIQKEKEAKKSKKSKNKTTEKPNETPPSTNGNTDHLEDIFKENAVPVTTQNRSVDASNQDSSEVKKITSKKRFDGWDL